MRKLLVNNELINDEMANQLVRLCPFGAIKYKNGKIEINYSLCRMCRICVKKSPRGVIEFVDQ
jgi:electron transfer flavoprotein alpha subunit